MRGLFTAGIMDVWMEHGITFDGVVGVSAGATFGCNYVSKQIGRVLRYNLRFAHDERYMGWRSFWRTGDFVGADFSYHYLPKELDLFDFDTFRNNSTEFHLVCTDTERGVPIYRHIKEMNDKDLDWLRASASLPILSRPVRLEGLSLLDGGITDSIPLRYFQEQGFERNVVILTQPAGFRKKQTRLMPLFHLTMRKYPAIIKAMARRHVMYNEQLDYLSKQQQAGNTLVVCPDKPLAISRTERNKNNLQRTYEMGREMGLRTLDAVKAFGKGCNTK